MLAARAILVRRKIPAKLRLEPQRGEQRCRRLQPDELLGVAAAGKREDIPHRQRKIAEHLPALLDGEIARIGKADAGEALRVARRTQSDQTVGFVIRQRAEKDRIDNAEQCDIGADSQGEPHDRDQGKTGRFEQLTRGIPDLGRHDDLRSEHRAFIVH